MSKLYKGIDISHWNPISWSELATNNLDFIILKISQYKSKDAAFESNYTNASKYFKAVGGYIYNKVKSVAEAEVEANFAVQCLKGKKMTGWVWLDMEDDTMRSLGKATLTAIIDTEANILKAAGYNVGIYTGNYWYKRVLDGAELSKRYKIWIARYSSNDNPNIIAPTSNSNMPYASIWQYSSKGQLDGVKSSGCDMDIMFEDLFGLGSSTASTVAKNETTATTTTSTVSVTSTNSLTAAQKKEWIKVGQYHSINFTGITIATDGIYGTNSKKQSVRVLQQALKLDYNLTSLKVDGNLTSATKAYLTGKTVKLNSNGYMVSALIILLNMHGYAYELSDNPAKCDSKLVTVIKQYQKDNGLTVDGMAGKNTFLSLVQ